jgi:hypothetical protein
MSAAYGGIQLPKSNPITMRFQKGQLVTNTSSFKPLPFYASVSNNTGLSQPPLRNMGSSTRKLGMAPMHIRTRRNSRRNSRRTYRKNRR